VSPQSVDSDSHPPSSTGKPAIICIRGSSLASAFLSSLLLHCTAFAVFFVVGGSLWTISAPAPLITTELVVAQPPPAPVELAPPPDLVPISPPKLAVRPEPLLVTPPLTLQPPSVPPPTLEQIMPPKLVEKTPIKLAPVPTPKKSLPKPQGLPPKPLQTSGDREKPRPGPPLPLPVDNQVAATGNVLGPPAMTPTDTPWQPAEGAAAGAGQLFERGDTAVVPGAGTGGGGGGAGNVGFGTGGSGGSAPVAGLQPGVGGEGPGGGVGSLARPLGGYQVKPRYPESARRQGIEGTTLLKIYVSDKGRVEDVLIERSAGHQDLDFAAAEAVKRWRFEPARRANQPVAVWVMLPVRFELR
jgi:periplasmic protein TonB